MAADVAEVLRAMQSCLGTPLDSVEAAVHKPLTKEGGTITHVALSFGKHKVCLGTAGSGGLRLADLAPVTDMGEFGRIEHEHFASPVVGRPLRRVSLLLSDELGPDDKEPVGVALGFDADERGSSTARMTFTWWTARPAGSPTTSFTSSSQRPSRSRVISGPSPGLY